MASFSSPKHTLDYSQPSPSESGRCRLLARILASIAVLPLALWLAGCSTTKTRSLDWQFVQAVGGIAIGTPHQRADGGWLLPVRCDVSGLQEITVKPTAINSALKIDRIKVWRLENRINLTLRASPFGDTSQTTNAFLGHLRPGDYSVFYTEKNGASHRLGSFTVAK